MKKTLLLLFAALMFAMPAAAGDSTWAKYFSSSNTGDATGAGATYLAFGGTVRLAGQIPVIKTANITSDLATSKLYLLTENGDSTTTDAAYSSGGKLLPVTATTSFQATTAGAGSWVAIYYPKTQKFEINRVSSITAGDTLNLVRNTVNTYPSGTTVYELTEIGGVLVGNTTKDWPTIQLTGEPGETLGWYVDGTSSCSVNYISGEYLSNR